MSIPTTAVCEFDSIIVPDDELKEGQPRLLTVDNPVVLPIKTNIRLLLTSNDVIHNWAMPSFGIKMDAIPGRLNETWFEVGAEDIGIYYGQCSELCGARHGYMPIAIEAVPMDKWRQWVASKGGSFGDEAEVSEAADIQAPASATRSISSSLSPLAALRAAPLVSGIRAMTC